MNEQEALTTIGRLIRDARVARGESQIGLAKRAGVDVRTLRSMEKGERWAYDVKRKRVEDALGWRIGSILEMRNEADHIPVGNITLEYMTQGAGEATWQELEKEANGGPVNRAALLSDEELLAEISYRFRNYKDQILRES